MLAFYRDVVGLEVWREYPDCVFLRIADGVEGHPQAIVLFDRAVEVGAERSTIDHFAFVISLEDYDERRRQLERLGLQVQPKGWSSLSVHRDTCALQPPALQIETQNWLCRLGGAVRRSASNLKENESIFAVARDRAEGLRVNRLQKRARRSAAVSYTACACSISCRGISPCAALEMSAQSEIRVASAMRSGRSRAKLLAHRSGHRPLELVAPELCTRTLLLYLLTSHQGVRLGSPKKFECLGSGADAKAAAGVPNVCPDCVRGQNE